jgi:molybdopterin converting factor small subunit
MKIRLQIYSHLRQYLPPADARFRDEQWEVAAGTTIAEIVQILNLPQNLKILTVVNDAFCHDRGRVLQEGDSLTLLPPMAGG